jgi:hypothetical protein
MSKADTMLFYAEFNGMQTAVHRTAVAKSWWDSPRSSGAKFCNLHGHVSDALEFKRKPPEGVEVLSKTGVVPHGRETEEQQRAFRS